MKGFAAGAVCLVAAVLIAMVDHGHAWSWSLLAWGAAIGVAGVAGSYALARLAHIDSNRWDAYPSFILTAAAFAVVAAGIDSKWVVIAFAAYVAVANFALPLALLPRLRRATSHTCSSSNASSSCSAEACAACPLSKQLQATQGSPH